MVLNIGLALLFFLPIIESFDRRIALSMLLVGSLLISFPFFWKRKILFDRIEMIFLMMLTVFAASTLFSWSIIRSFPELLRYTAYFLLFVSIRRFEEKEELIKNFFIPMVILNSVILSLLFILYSLPLQTSLPFVRRLPQPLSMNLFLPTFGHNRIADILIFALPLSVFGLTNHKKKLWQGIIVFFMVIFLFSLGRGAMLSLSFAFLFFLLFLNGKNELDRYISGKLYSVTVILGLLTIAMLLSSFLYSNFLPAGNPAIPKVKGFYKMISDENRPDFIYQAAKGFSLSPIFGTGLDTFRYLSRMYQDKPASWSWYTHNHYLEVFTETGIFGGILFLILIVVLFRSMVKEIDGNGGKQIYEKALFIGIFASGIHSLMDYDWQYISVFLIFWLIIAILTETEKTEKQSEFIPLFYLFILVVFLSFPFLPSVEKLIDKFNENEANKRPSVAINYLLISHRLDPLNTDVIQNLVRYYQEISNNDKIHYWISQEIRLNVLDSGEYVRQDYLLYLDQASYSSEYSNLRDAVDYLRISYEKYPFYHLMISGNDYILRLNKSLAESDRETVLSTVDEYIEKARDKAGSVNLEPYQLNRLKTLPLIMKSP